MHGHSNSCAYPRTNYKASLNTLFPKKTFFSNAPYSLAFYQSSNLFFPTKTNYFIQNLSLDFKTLKDSYIIGSFSKKELYNLETLHKSFIKPSLTSFLNLTPKTPSPNLLKCFSYDKRGFFRFNQTDITYLLCQSLPKDQFIHYFDSDDYMQKDCIQTCIKALSKDTEVVVHDNFVFLDGMPVEAKRGHLRAKYFPSQLYPAFKNRKVNGDGLYKLASKAQLNFGWHGLISNAYLNKISLRFTPSLDMEDLNFGMILLAKARHIKVLKDMLIGYRVRQDSICNYGESTKVTIPSSLKYLSTHFKSGYDIRTYFNIFCHFFAALDIYLALYRFRGLSKESIKSVESQLVILTKSRIWNVLDYERKDKDPLNAFFIAKWLEFLKTNKNVSVDMRLALGMDEKCYVHYKWVLIPAGGLVRKTKRAPYLAARFIYRRSGLKAFRKKRMYNKLFKEK
ncbi:hypothetical protein [Helicobacter sp. 11S02629-2]|uniref:hypothetical protein n=1 Tax=Helicobacter sp. 11S02629-2 TaxID=1476195 RepID=UPI000BA61E36|nr:hypothetical protein [Helicobacter sp. 11S02629-2]PAF45797.1 hypothetical protein BKH40_02695 [Helicobacter sp. 11S02629-2]